ncbi:enoyl-CoA hydratase/isomerase family protein [Solimonas sp. K1W22B-7]|uniref:enoyl-CoA hydratase/isomerase family protein n=1 Tax=Solimonas sp. K1W22B-7 TaxID=2303331 RepID=UPI000E333916|nr:enoyl-CoA hydratase/isomerase family protein [Solimonas sp. K1W22B-7]AXQ27802.1 enoyl-CoA hydratase/isomerase family protein [Solimonas sp. K1W22B-7]
MNPEPGITVEARGAIEILTLNQPDALNVLTPEVIDELADYYEALQHRTEVRVVILRSTGRAFCAGADLGSQAFAEAGSGRIHRQGDIQQRYASVIRLMRSCPQPVIGLVHAAACGAGFSLVLACDIRYAAPEAKMNAAYLRVGLGGCDLGSGYLLPRLVGLGPASEFLLSGRFIGAERALRMGLVSEVVPAGQLLDTGLAMAADMLRASPLGLRMTKETLNALIDAPSLDAALMIENRQQIMLTGTEDHLEAVAAFRDKREPRYRER